MKPIYLDCNATTPIEDEVRDIMTRYLASEYGNAGSRTHLFGQEANKAVEDSRRQVAEVVSAEKDEVIFTSGATESNNIAILGLRKFAIESGKNHIISSSIEHKAVLEPLEYLSKNGFEITLIDVDESGVVDPKNIEAAIN
jgi:cysteine desulfurase